MVAVPGRLGVAVEVGLTLCVGASFGVFVEVRSDGEEVEVADGVVVAVGVSVSLEVAVREPSLLEPVGTPEIVAVAVGVPHPGMVVRLSMVEV